MTTQELELKLAELRSNEVYISCDPTAFPLCCGRPNMPTDGTWHCPCGCHLMPPKLDASLAFELLSELPCEIQVRPGDGVTARIWINKEDPYDSKWISGELLEVIAEAWIAWKEQR